MAAVADKILLLLRLLLLLLLLLLSGGLIKVRRWLRMWRRQQFRHNLTASHRLSDAKC